MEVTAWWGCRIYHHVWRKRPLSPSMGPPRNEQLREEGRHLFPQLFE